MQCSTVTCLSPRRVDNYDASNDWLDTHPMQRRHLSLALAATALLPATALAQTPPRIGVLMLHGKNPGSNQDPSMTGLQSALARKGWAVAFPDMPWSRRRYIDGHWDQAMAEIAGHVKTLQDQGARHIVLLGHSLGVPAAMSHAARGGTAHALVLLAPGHVPRNYYRVPQFRAVRDSVDEARALVAAGKVDATERFSDINQGRALTVVASPRNYLSYFDPESDAEMGVTAPRIPPSVPVLTAIGQKDSLFPWVRSYYVDSLPPHPKTRLLETPGGHLDTPREAQDALIAWIEASLPE